MQSVYQNIQEGGVFRVCATTIHHCNIYTGRWRTNSPYIFTRSSDFECLRKRKTIQRTFQITSQNLQLDKLRLRVIMTLTVCVSVEARCTITFICRALTFHFFVLIPPTYENRLEVVEVARPRSVSLSIILSHPTFWLECNAFHRNESLNHVICLSLFFENFSQRCAQESQMHLHPPVS